MAHPFLKLHKNCVTLDKYEKLKQQHLKLAHDYELLKFDYLQLKSKLEKLNQKGADT